MTYDKIHDLFKKGYDQKSWKQFLGETFAKARLLARPEDLTGIDSNVAKKALKLGHLLLDENGIERQISVYEVTLRKGIVLERNRVGLRNLLRKHWKDIDAAFIVYHNPDNNKWRFTYVSELTGYDADGEFVKIKTEPKRYTYVLGEGESTRTAAERFAIIAKKGSNATLEDVKDAFSVEKLSKEFFSEYKKHYDVICSFMLKKPGIKQTIFKGDEKEIRDFSKKLLGRIVFLYFIQKKGWLGVPKIGKWGEGDLQFMSNLFNNQKSKDLFYSQTLTKLFFDTLNTKRKDDLTEFVKGESCRIPYLNGGLFEEDNKNHRNIIFDSDIFEDLFNFFNQYNFTIYEDDPNDHTIAVDPEMLGHIFENLLEDNKDKGAYYTPKEIVHYMCQESLIEYLTTWFENKGYDVEGFITITNPGQPGMFLVNEKKKGQTVLEMPVNEKKIDRALIEKLLKKKLDVEDRQMVKEHSKEFHEALDSVKICDPAIGSGAFPMGLLQEIFTAKQTLHFFKYGSLVNFPASEVKLNIIQNSIYGVDIEKGAVDIARLRFWLSLVVDEDEPKPLPNLDYKIVVGNSLVSKLGDEIIDIDWNIDTTKGGMFVQQQAEEVKDILDKIFAEQKEFFNPDCDKMKLAKEIRDLKIKLLISQLELMVAKADKEKAPKRTDYKDNKNFVKAQELYMQTIGWKENIRQLKELSKKRNEPLHFFDWKLDFPEVMNEQVSKNVGFDIVIGNPPYVRRTSLTLNDKISFGNKFLSAHEQYDLYILFIELGMSLTKIGGCLVFINPNKFFTSNYGFELRCLLAERYSLRKVIDISQVKVFENALTYPCLLFIKNIYVYENVFLYCKLSNLRFDEAVFLPLSQSTIVNDDKKYFIFSNDIITNKIIEKIESETNHLEKFYNCARGLPNSKICLVKKGGVAALKSTFINRFCVTSDRVRVELRDSELYSKYRFAFKDQLIIMPRTVLSLRAALKPADVFLLDRIYFLTPKTTRFESVLLLSLLNSKLLNFWFEFKYGSSKLQGGYFDLRGTQICSIPIRKFQKFGKIVSLTLRVLSDSSKGISTQILENKIDNILYRLYELTYEEVKVIDPEFGLTKSEYEGIKID